MGPEKLLPYNDSFANEGEYVDSLVNLVGSHDLLRTLCGGVHILDFYTSDPPLYERVLPQEWREFFSQIEVQDVLDLFMTQDLDQFGSDATSDRVGRQENVWQRAPERHLPVPPQSLVDYVATVRRHMLLRSPGGSQCARNRALKPTQKLVRDVAVGMNVKKVHEVGLFAHYLNHLAEDVQDNVQAISHLVDFGSGQNYLGRALASEPYNKRIVAIESRSQNSERAKEYDIQAGLAKKQKVMRNKKLFRTGQEDWSTPQPPVPEPDGNGLPTPPSDGVSTPVSNDENVVTTDASLDPSIALSTQAKGSVQYFEHSIADGDLSDVVTKLEADHPDPRLMVMSLHSCGNLVHHGLRSLVLNPAVKVVAMVGCCYNLVTERLTGGSYKLPGLDPQNKSDGQIANDGSDSGFLERRCDPHGFPMSQRLCDYKKPDAPPESQSGISLNITARMMAVQAPQNWGPAGSSEFFNRHFYRALLQRIFLDKGVVGPPSNKHAGGCSPAGHSSGGTPIIIGHLKKGYYANFVAYVRGAVSKLASDQETEIGRLVREKLADLTDHEIIAYEESYRRNKKDLSVIWSLMAFSAGVVEAMIVVDRWLWLKEQQEVKEAWVEGVFDYAMSPRNLVVVGVKK